jgi:hypothetical protein
MSDWRARLAEFERQDSVWIEGSGSTSSMPCPVSRRATLIKLRAVCSPLVAVRDDSPSLRDLGAEIEDLVQRRPHCR